MPLSETTRTFWDKVVSAHGLRRWYDERRAALANLDLGADCVRHARMFFDRSDYYLASAVPGTFAIEPASKMVDPLARD